MGIPSGKPADARNRAEPRRGHDLPPARTRWWRSALKGGPRGLTRAASALLVLVLAALGAAGSASAQAEAIRIATFAAPLSREGPGLLLRDILRGDDPQLAAVIAVVERVRPDILVLTDFDWDMGLAALDAFAERLDAGGIAYPYRLALEPNSGRPSGADLDGNGRLGEARDSLGYGRFSGDGGIAILSRFVFGRDVQDFSGLLWRDLPGATLPVRPDGSPFPDAPTRSLMRLSSVAHWIVPVEPPDGPGFSLMVWSGSPPVFDGPEDQNGLRNRDELKLWQAVLDGTLGQAPDRFVILGNANLDPEDGDGLRATMTTFLADPRLIDPRPASAGGRAAADPGQSGDPALDTADWEDGTPGNLRVSYVLPSAGIEIAGSGVFWPAPDDPDAALLGGDGLLAGPHHLVWVDILP